LDILCFATSQDAGTSQDTSISQDTGTSQEACTKDLIYMAL